MPMLAPSDGMKRTYQVRTGGPDGGTLVPVRDAARFGIVTVMRVVEGASEHIRGPQTSKSPVMVDCWAEAVIDLARAQSRRRHPSNLEPAGMADDGYEPTDWAV